MKYTPIIWFTLVFILFLSVDLFVLNKWKKYVKSRNINNYAYYLPYLLAFIMAGLNLWIVVYRLTVFGSNSYLVLAYAIVSVWYLPKLVIAPFLLFSSLGRRSINFLSNKFKKQSNQIKKTSSNSDSSNNSNISKTATSSNKRREFLKGAGWTLASAPFVVALNGAINTVYDYEITSTNIFINNLPLELEGLKIVQISDFHAGSFYSDSPVRKMREIIESIEPDILVMTGDFVNFHHDEFKHVYKEFSKMKARYGVYGCLGNHDHYMRGDSHKQLINLIESSGVQLLINKNIEIPIKGSFLNLAGVDNWGRGQEYADFEGTIAQTNNKYPTVLLCHDPSNWKPRVRETLNIDLMLSGHTHGGQIGFEYEGISLNPVEMVYKEYSGLYEYGEKKLYVNRGCGVVGPPIRIGVRPEISLFYLKSPVNIT